MTNYEKIKNMSIEEMAEWLDEILSERACSLCTMKDIDQCGYEEQDYFGRIALCVRNRKQWLESEVEE